MMKVIGLTGNNASGKTEAAEYLRRKGYRYYSLSDILREEATRRGLDHSRKTLIELGNNLRKGHGAGVLAKMAKENLKGRSIIIDSIRNPKEIEELKM
ncbi:MAG: AAA family ATPase, partial [Candidatus Omnitrophica bacterium]|nr:AAA family ATPase [Candidatus Omnitrophota bacterium]